MAYYDPYDNSQSSYYDPTANAEGPSQGVGQTLKTMALTMAGYAATSVVFSKAAGMINKGIGKTAAKYAKTKLQNTRSGVRSTISPEHRAKLNRIAKANTAGEALAGASNRFNRIYKKVRSDVSNIQKTVNTRQAEINRLKKIDPLKAQQYRFKSAFKDGKTFKDIALNNFHKSVMVGSIAGYAVDAATGNLENMGVRGDIGALNLPGHAINYTKYMVKNMGMFAGMGNIGLMFNGARAGIGGAAKQAFAKNKGFTDSVLGFAAKVSNVNVKGAISGVANEAYKTSDFQQQIHNSLIRRAGSFMADGLSAVTSTLGPKMADSVRRPFGKNFKNRGQSTANQSAKSFSAKVNSVATQIKNSFKQKTEIRKNRLSEGLGGMEQIEAALKMARSGSNSPLKSTNALASADETFNNLTNILSNKNAKPSWTASILGLESLKAKDVLQDSYIKQTLGELKPLYPKDKEQQVYELLSNVNVGKSFKKHGDMHLDLNYMAPPAVLKKLATTAISKMNFKLPIAIPGIGKNLSFDSIFMTNTLASQEVKAHTWTAGDSGNGFGFKVETRAGIKQISDLLGELKIGRSEYDSVGVHLANNRMYVSQGGSIKELDTLNQYMTLTSPAINGDNEFKSVNTAKYLWQKGKAKIYGKDVTNLQDVSKVRKQGRFSGGILSKIANKFDWSHTHLANKMTELETIMGNFRVNPQTGNVSTYSGKLANEMIETLSGRDTAFSGQNFRTVLKSMMDDTEAVLAHVIRREPEAMQYLANQTKSFGDITDPRTFREILKEQVVPNRLDGDAVFPELLKNQETAALYNQVIHNPKQARKHILRENKGHLREINAYDSMFLKYNALIGGLDDESGHMFFTAADHLSKKGIITNTEKQAMKLYAFAAEVTHSKIGKGITSYQDEAIKHKIFKRVKGQTVDHMTDITGYIRDNKMHMPTLTRSKTALEIAVNNGGQSGKLGRDTAQIAAFGYEGDSAAGSIMRTTVDVASNRVARLISGVTGFQKDPFKYGNGFIGNAKFIATRGAQIAAAATAYKAVDAAVASAPIFDDTGLDAGITGFLADNVASTHLLAARALNMTGLAGAGRYLEGLMPGFTSSAPGAIAGAAMAWGSGGTSLVTGAIGGAISNRLVAQYMPDFTKTYDQLEAEYSGQSEVPIIQGKGWLLGTTPIQGNKVVGWKPNWYVETKSRWKASETLYGSEFNKLLHEPLPVIGVSIGDVVDPYKMERLHYYDRPYPVTGGWQENIPFGIGSLVSKTIGQIFKPRKMMHKEFLLHGDKNKEANEATAMPVPNMTEQRVFMKSAGAMNQRKAHNRTASFMGAYVYNNTTNAAQTVADDHLIHLADAAGLVGFVGNTARNALVDKNTVFPTLESAGRMASMSRAYYDQSFGGIGIVSEAMRRFVYKPEYKNYGVNPIPNMLPNWLPKKFLTGDPYEKILKGELRLPGRAYELTHDTDLDMPGRASMFGGNVKDIVSYFTGHKSPLLKEEHEILETGTQFHENIQNWLKSENILISAENFVYDARNNISGHIDGVIKDGLGGKGRRALEIKSISDKGFKKLAGPKYQHVGQLNFYLHQMKMKKGTILYVSRDNPSDFKVYEINYDPNRYAKDLEKIQQARKIASVMLTKNREGFSKGFSYSWVDRMNILADVAPASKEFKEAKWVVQQQMSNGMLSERDLIKYNKAIKHREATLRNFELNPLRFKGKMLSPDSEYNRQSINENIKAGAEYSLPERIVGAAWENFTNTDTFLVNKFFAYKDPLEHYKLNQVYGKEFAPWTDPYGSFVKTKIDRTAGADNPLSGAITGALDIGYLIGGSPMAMVGGLLGAAAGAKNMVFGQDKSWLPDNIKQQREINDYFDTMKYHKNMRMASLSTGMESTRYRNQANQTFFGMMQDNSTNYTNIYRSAYASERPYISAWLNERDPDRQEEILRTAPERLGHILKNHWQDKGSELNTRELIDMKSGEFKKGSSPQYDMRVLDPGMRTEDIKLKVVKSEGLNAHDFGLGWGEQMMRVQDNMESIAKPDVKNDYDHSSLINPGTVRMAIMNLLINHGLNPKVQVYVNDHVNSDRNRVTVTVQHNKLTEIRRAIDFRRKYT